MIRIVITDDHAVFRSGLRSLMEKEEDIEVVGEADRGEKAIELAGRLDFDVLILDISMPGIPSVKAAEAILELKPNLAIIVLSMHQDEYYLQEFFRIGARGYVLKKSTSTELVQAIHAAYRGDNFVDPALAKLVISPYVGKPMKQKPTRLEILTPRERDICTHVAHGYTNVEIAEKLNVSVRTVETHRTNIMTKLDMKNRAELVRFALDNGLLGKD